MERFAVFVDAGRLLAEGGKLCFGVSKRAEIDCNYESVAAGLIDFASRHCGCSFLRLYWYDGAQKGIPTLDHLQIAGLT